MDSDAQKIFGTKSLDAFLYADDTLLIGVSQRNVQHLSDAVANIGANYGMELHWKKFQLVQIGKEYNFSTPDGSIIELLDMMTYLGATLYANGGLKKELILYGRLIRAPDTDPLRSLTFIEETTQLKSSICARRRGRPRNEWATMLQKKCWNNGADYHQNVYVEDSWRRVVARYCT